jgi:hypothetical protein
MRQGQRRDRQWTCGSARTWRGCRSGGRPRGCFLFASASLLNRSPSSTGGGARESHIGKCGRLSAQPPGRPYGQVG